MCVTLRREGQNEAESRDSRRERPLFFLVLISILSISLPLPSLSPSSLYLSFTLSPPAPNISPLAFSPNLASSPLCHFGRNFVDYDFLVAFSGGKLATFGRCLKAYFACADGFWDQIWSRTSPARQFWALLDFCDNLLTTYFSFEIVKRAKRIERHFNRATVFRATL